MVADAKNRGLTVDRWPARIVGPLGWGVLAVVALLIAASAVGGDAHGDVNAVAAIAAFVAVLSIPIGVGILGRLGRSLAQLPTESGATAAATARALQRTLHEQGSSGGGFTDLPPAGGRVVGPRVRVRGGDGRGAPGRHDARARRRGRSQGLERRRRPLAEGPRPLPTRVAARLGQASDAGHPARAGVGWRGRGRDLLARPAGERGPRPQPRIQSASYDWVDRIAFVAIGLCALLVVWSVWVLVRAVPDLWARRTVTGEIVRDRRRTQVFASGNDPKYWYYVAVDDGIVDTVAGLAGPGGAVAAVPPGRAGRRRDHPGPGLRAIDPERRRGTGPGPRGRTPGALAGSRRGRDHGLIAPGRAERERPSGRVECGDRPGRALRHAGPLAPAGTGFDVPPTSTLVESPCHAQYGRRLRSSRTTRYVAAPATGAHASTGRTPRPWVGVESGTDRDAPDGTEAFRGAGRRVQDAELPAGDRHQRRSRRVARRARGRPTAVELVAQRVFEGRRARPRGTGPDRRRPVSETDEVREVRRADGGELSASPRAAGRPRRRGRSSSRTCESCRCNRRLRAATTTATRRGPRSCRARSRRAARRRRARRGRRCRRAAEPPAGRRPAPSRPTTRSGWRRTPPAPRPTARRRAARRRGGRPSSCP